MGINNIYNNTEWASILRIIGISSGPFWKNIGMKILVTSNRFDRAASLTIWQWPCESPWETQVLLLGAFGFGVVDYRLFDVNFQLFDIVFMFDAICFWVASSWFLCRLGRTTPFDFILFWLVGVKSFFVSTEDEAHVDNQKSKTQITFIQRLRLKEHKAHERHLSGICGAESSWRRSCRCPGKDRKVKLMRLHSVWWSWRSNGDVQFTQNISWS